MNLITVNNLTPDSACRTFFSNDIHFASFSNAVLFDGKQLIHPERLVRYENDTSFIINDTKSVEDKKEEGILSSKPMSMGSIVFLASNIKVRLM